MPDGNVLVWLALAGILVYGAHASAIGIKNGVHKIFHRNPAKVLVQPVKHPKKDLQTIIKHETK